MYYKNEPPWRGPRDRKRAERRKQADAEKAQRLQPRRWIDHVAAKEAEREAKEDKQ